MKLEFRFTVSSEVFARECGGSWRGFGQPCSFVPGRLARMFGAHANQLDWGLDDETFQPGVLEAEGLYVAGQPGWVFTPDGRFLSGHSWYGQHADEIREPVVVSEVRRLRGRTLTLLTDWSGINYAHFLNEGLGRLAMLEDVEDSLAAADQILVAAPDAISRDLCRRMGVPSDRILEPRRGLVFKTEHLLAPSFPGIRRRYPAWVPEFLRARLGVAGRRGKRRVYLKRKGIRNIMNESELIPVLDRFGIEMVDSAMQPDPVAYFSDVEFVTGPHGAGYANLVFVPSGAKVLELLPLGQPYPYFYTLAVASGHEYACLPCPSQRPRAPGEIGPNTSHFEVNPEVFAESLQVMLE